MADDITKTHRAQEIISLADRQEVNYWIMALGCTEDELREAVRDVGRSVEEVRAYLRQRR